MANTHFINNKDPDNRYITTEDRLGNNVQAVFTVGKLNK